MWKYLIVSSELAEAIISALLLGNWIEFIAMKLSKKTWTIIFIEPLMLPVAKLEAAIAEILQLSALNLFTLWVC
ncbi:unnamed protein product [Blepharisma stoltei]|uniref:Uncharacterized protein n=1 Tax=Blepharisma stoltei TaxID=1481888 RepID=A0AAU9K239_9CILI|nr:unnamed protein product [Blepharisma stoltei]